MVPKYEPCGTPTYFLVYNRIYLLFLFVCFFVVVYIFCSFVIAFVLAYRSRLTVPTPDPRENTYRSSPNGSDEGASSFRVAASHLSLFFNSFSLTHSLPFCLFYPLALSSNITLIRSLAIFAPLNETFRTRFN